MLAVFLVLIVPLALPYVALAQVAYERGAHKVTVEAFANLTAAASGDDDRRGDNRLSGRVDSEARFVWLARTDDKLSVGGRVTLRADTDSEPELGERSLIALAPWVRLEIGNRRGLPDVLTGYAPNAYQFASAEHGPASGRSLDPDGGLQTAYLDEGVAGEINRLTGLGVTASFFFDESAKIIYVSPKRHGFLGGVSYSPDAEDPERRFGSLVQAGLVYERYGEQNVVRIGGSYAFADGERRSGGMNATRDLHSVSGGISYTHDDDLTFGASFTYNGDSGLPEGAPFRSDALGYAFSVNYNNGPWTVAALYQSAQSAGDALQAGTDHLQAAQAGASYRFNTKVRLYGAFYYYSFDDERGNAESRDLDGGVFLLGTRVAL